MTKKQTIVAASAVGVMGLATIFGAQGVQAEDATNTNPMSSLVQAIAQKFNLNQSDVQAVFDQQKTQMDTQRAKDEADRLQTAVDQGKITATQKDKIVAKRQELEASREANRDKFSNMTDDERKAAMEQERSDLEQWATDNDIPMEYLHGGPGGHGGFSGPGGPPSSQDSSNSSQSQ